ncbi:peptide-methionine (S)-S-oxide reductase MsrA [Helcococcus kunzii]|uniref:Peptide methionine sulfoxide reductase MsrA n=1 Tax=Helcococcus kunzii ATCC 51366 TaxID=883114 RepID=H3NMT8_9FIRM|nr:peptide-methionine (S)-S-oxide reductase MsrA [Helcococcus kunzii]EHR34679.1 peptide-methionine (S)-S-oxide reductase [Helcococcus kunzii ATCC 51366]EHR35881.1 peptide-methionine (S)-S-oxide reductase [Helcococcus kunzii ATCC 51366]MCT1796665.1 peptide-methionine (S)-S-oxide reductase MsrA [Helcococcus kunzii]MCT1989069.1 peptide-methionine (S)-S-oxide reductase MsrA [Helcococcus kunzii]QUY64588.1 peptide-methionine (S)-S-oxide reductase MsrA [Helcococcus kunzii]
MTNKNNNLKEIYLAGGCFWGTQAYFDQIDGVVETEVGYANGVIENPTYEQVCTGSTGFAETTKIIYDADKINLYQILEQYFRTIDPTSLNKQGGDVGTQYRTGIYTLNSKDRQSVREFFELVKNNYNKEIVVENKILENYYPAEEYHQKYLQKNPGGYCHVDLSLAKEDSQLQKYTKPDEETLKQNLTKTQFEVTQNADTEMPFSSEYDTHYEKGIYVDIVTKQPLFASTDKFDAGCGWPSFSKPIDNSLNYFEDNKLSRKRIEVKSKSGDTHLGHVFNDGPKELGGLRYCINGASLEFIPYEEMDERGYSEYKKLVE